MRRSIVVAVIALVVMVVVPFASAGTTVTTRHIDGSVKVLEPARSGVPINRYWLARFEVRTTPDGAIVQFGYMHLYGITSAISGSNAGAIHEFSVSSVTYSKTPTGLRATLHMEECTILDEQAHPGGCGTSDYEVSDASPDTFNPVGLTGSETWSVVPGSGNISIYSTGGQNTQ
jgi:hypothetical protein